MAGAKPAIQVTGAKELRKALSRMGADLRDFTKVNRAVAEMVASLARQKAPVRTGRLQRTIRAGATTRRGTVSAGRTSVPYAGPIHFGWPSRNIEPQPFIYTALDSRRDEVLADYRARVDELVVRVGRETP